MSAIPIAAAVCAQHYTPPPARSTCDQCPLHAACSSPCGGGAEALRAWQQRVEQAANATEAAS